MPMSFFTLDLKLRMVFQGCNLNSYIFIFIFNQPNQVTIGNVLLLM